MRIPDTITRPSSLGAALKYELDRDFCRETRTLKASNSALITSLLAEHPTETDASGAKKLVPWAPAASDSTADVVAMACDDYEAPVGVDNDLVQVLVRGPAMLFGNGIAWPAGVTANQKKAAIADLKALNILVR